MDAAKRQRYDKISEELTELVGGRDNIQGVAHCATRLRIVLKDNDLADLKAIEDVDLAKGVFVAGDQVQIIFGAGLVNDVYQVFAENNNMKNMSLSDLKTEANKKMNPLQRIIKALSDVFVDIMPGILAAALLTGLSGVLGNMEFVKANATLYGINTLINIASGAIFGFLPLAVAYSACKRFGGKANPGHCHGLHHAEQQPYRCLCRCTGHNVSHNSTYLWLGSRTGRVSRRYHRSVVNGVCDS